MSKSMVGNRVKNLADALKSLGFSLDGSFRLKRNLKFIDQFIELQPGDSWLEGNLTCNICWKFTADEIPVSDVYDYVVNLGFVVGDNALWLSQKTKEELDASFDVFRRHLFEEGVPFLDTVSDLQAILRMYEQSELETLAKHSPMDPRLFFGVDDGWKCYNLGFAYKVLGDLKKAAECFEIVLSEHSCESFSWVQERKRLCEQVLSAF